MILDRSFPSVPECDYIQGKLHANDEQDEFHVVDKHERHAVALKKGAYFYIPTYV